MVRPRRNALGGALQRLPEGRVAEGRDLAGGHVGRADGLVGDRRDPAGHARRHSGGEPGSVDGCVDTADHGHAERAADQPGGVVHGRADACLAPRDGAHDGLGGGRRGQAHAEPVQHHLDRDDAVTDRRAGGRRHPAVERGHRDEPDGDDELGPGPHGELGPRYRSGAHRQRHREQANAGGERAVAPDELEVLGHQEDEAEQGEERHRDRAAGRAEPQVAEEPHIEHRVRGTPLAHDERGEQDSRGGKAGQAARRCPPVGRRLDDGEDQQGHGCRRQHQAGEVRSGRVRVLRRGNGERHEDQRRPPLPAPWR